MSLLMRGFYDEHVWSKLGRVLTDLFFSTRLALIQVHILAHMMSVLRTVKVVQIHCFRLVAALRVSNTVM